MHENLIPFHLQAEDVGTFVIQERAREAEERGEDERPLGPSENTD